MPQRMLRRWCLATSVISMTSVRCPKIEEKRWECVIVILYFETVWVSALKPAGRERSDVMRFFCDIVILIPHYSALKRKPLRNVLICEFVPLSACVRLWDKVYGDQRKGQHQCGKCMQPFDSDEIGMFLLFHAKFILLVFPLGSQAFLTLARDIKSKMDTKLVWKTDTRCNCMIWDRWGNVASKWAWKWTRQCHSSESFLWHLQEGNAPQGGSHGVKISEPQKKTSFFRCSLLWGPRPFSHWLPAGWT